MTERDLNDYGYDHDIILDVNGTDIVVRFANGTEILDSDLEQLNDNDLDHDLPWNATHLHSTPARSRPSSINANFTTTQSVPMNDSNVHQWNISAIDVDASRKQFRGTNGTKSMLTLHAHIVTTYDFETHQVPDGEAIDIIALSEMYIRGQIASSNTTNNLRTTDEAISSQTLAADTQVALSFQARVVHRELAPTRLA